VLTPTKNDVSEDCDLDEDDTEGCVFDYPSESSPMINRHNTVNSMDVSGTGRKNDNLKMQYQSNRNMKSEKNQKFNEPCFTYHTKNSSSMGKA
jgi:hypothetical protein